MITVQSDDDCKQTSFIQSLMPVSLFFQMFNALTNYHGVEIDSSNQEVLHKFKVRQFDESNTLSPRFFFYFDEELVFKKARFEQVDVGHYDFVSTVPMKERTFSTHDFYTGECE